MVYFSLQKRKKKKPRKTTISPFFPPPPTLSTTPTPCMFSHRPISRATSHPDWASHMDIKFIYTDQNVCADCKAGKKISTVVLSNLIQTGTGFVCVCVWSFSKRVKRSVFVFCIHMCAYTHAHMWIRTHTHTHTTKAAECPGREMVIYLQDASVSPLLHLNKKLYM